jgi:hypothetical protein
LTIVGIVESLCFIVIVISLRTFDFTRSNEQKWLLRALALAIFTFAVLAVGQNVVGENTGVAELYLYAGATGVLLGLVLHLPPYRD